MGYLNFLGTNSGKNVETLTNAAGYINYHNYENFNTIKIYTVAVNII